MKRLAALLMAGVMVFSMTACKAEDFDAKGYVHGVLDAQYHGEYAEHAEDIGETEEEVREEIEKNQFDECQTILSTMGIPVSDEEVQEFVDIIKDGYKKIEYEVQEPVKDDDDNFTVDVVVTPVGLLDGWEDLLMEKLTAAVTEGVDENGYMAVVNESVKESVDQAKTLDPQTVTLHVNWSEDEDGNHVYEIPKEDLDTFDSIAINQN